jgi:NADH-quinone oxidoreductase subunit J
LIIFLNADFLGLVYLVVYVGAIAVLFLFVVMMLDLRTLERSYGWPFYMFTAIFISLFFVFIFLCFVLFFKEKGATDNFDFDFFFKNEDMNDWMLLWFSYFNVEVLGQIIYTHFFLNFILCGFLLLLGMVGAIILALQPFKRNFNLTKSTIRKSMSEQVLREAHLRFFKKNV